MKPPPAVTFAEVLESRIAPAVLVSPTTVTYTDFDGDAVTVEISKGALTASDLVFDSDFAAVGPQRLLLIDFAGDRNKSRVDLTITAVTGGGDGLAHVGYLDATGIDLGSVSLPGDLGRISAGDAIKKTAGLDELTVGSFGIQPVGVTQQPGGTLLSSINGAINTLTVTGDVTGAVISVLGSIRSADVGGNILGGADPMSGSIRVEGSIGQIHVGGDLVGGDGDDSGRIFARHDIDVLTLDGSLKGGMLAGSQRTGQIAANDKLGQIIIGGNAEGGSGDQSGQIAARDGITSVTVNGSVIGGAGLESGIIGSRGTISSVVIKQSLMGGTGPTSGAVLADATINSVVIGQTTAFADIVGGTGDRSGIIASTKGVRDVIVHGSVIGGIGDTSGAIGSTRPLGSVTIDGDLRGGAGPRSGEIVSAASIRDVHVAGSVHGGGGDESGAIGATGAIQSITIGGDFIGDMGFHSGWIISGARIATLEIAGSAGTSGLGSGIIESRGLIGSISIGGDIGGRERNPSSIRAGSLGSLEVTGSIFSSSQLQASISVRKSIGSIEVRGDVVGNAQGFDRLSIAAGTFIEAVSVGGSVSFSEIVVGAGTQGELPGEFPANPDARLGTMTVGGSWASTSVAVGTFAGSDGLFGTTDDPISHGGNPTIFGTIERITIAGSAGASSGEVFTAAGIVAENIRVLSIAGTRVALKAGPSNDLVNIDPQGGNFFAREIPVGSVG